MKNLVRLLCGIGSFFTPAIGQQPSAMVSRPKDTASHEVLVSNVALHYAGYKKVTDKEVLVNPELARLCIGASFKQVQEAARIHGPHTHAEILVYMNDRATASFRTSAGEYPVGSVVVKQKVYLGHRDLKSDQWVRTKDKGVGGMIKRAPGYDPENGDWEYFYFEDPATIEAGRIASCIQCHQGAKSTDRVFGTWHKQKAARPAWPDGVQPK